MEQMKSDKTDGKIDDRYNNTERNVYFEKKKRQRKVKHSFSSKKKNFKKKREKK